MPTSPQNGELPVCFMRLPLLGRQHYRLSICNYFEKSRLVYFWVGFKPIFENRIFFIVLSCFFLLYGKQTESLRKERSNQKIEKNKTVLKSDLLFTYYRKVLPSHYL